MRPDIRRSWRLFGWTLRFCFRPIWRWGFLRDWGWEFRLERDMNSRCYCPDGWYLFWRTPLGVVWLDADPLAVGPCWCDVGISDAFGHCVECSEDIEPNSGGWCGECLAQFGLTEAPHA